MDTVSASILKSVLQKAFRRCATHLVVPVYGRGSGLVNVEFEAVPAITRVFDRLASMPGSLVPNIGRFVRGVEAAFKRLAVTVGEDSSIRGVESLVSSVLATALVAQRVPTWTPGSEMFDKAHELIAARLQYPRWNVYDLGAKTAPPAAPRVSEDSTAAQLNANLIRALRSFQGDIELFHSLAANPIVESTREMEGYRPLHITEALDQHCMARITYLMSLLAPYARFTSFDSLKPLVKLLWDSLGRYNPRRHAIENRVLYDKCRAVAAFADIVRRPVTEEMSVTGETVDFYPVLDPRILSSMTGLHVYSGGIRVASMFKNGTIVGRAFKRPGRGKSAPRVKSKAQKKAEAKALLQFREMVMSTGLRVVNPVTPDFKGATFLVLDGKLRCVFRDGTSHPWPLPPRAIKMVLPVHPDEEVADCNAGKSGAGMKAGAVDAWKARLESIPLARLQRLVMYLQQSGIGVRMHAVSRDGSGTDLAVTPEEPNVYRILLFLASIMPCALTRLPGLVGFSSRQPLVLQAMARLAKDTLTRRSASVDIGVEWPMLGERRADHMVMMPHQVRAIDAMDLSGANVIVIPTGKGKSRVIFEMMKRLQAAGLLPAHVFFTLPRSALASVAAEAHHFGIPTSLLHTLRGKAKDIPAGCMVTGRPIAGRMTFVLHDHMRRKAVRDAMLEHISDSVFVCDEVHKAMNMTQRTSAAISCARLARLFVGMTATPIIDNDAEKLMQWLRLIVPYAVTTRNMWSAMMEINTHVVVSEAELTYETVVAPVPGPVHAQMKALLPVRLGGTNETAGPSDFKAAYELCMGPATRKIVELGVAAARDGGVLLVARNDSHAFVLETMMKKVLGEGAVVRIDARRSVNMPADYKGPIRAVVAPIRRAEGYTLTALHTMITSVYPSNQACRTQMEGRLDRIGQTHVHYVTVMCGLMEVIHKHHASAATLEALVKTLSK